LITGGAPLIRGEGLIDFYPVRVPMVDVSAIGSGGGSIAWIDGAGSLKVGPHSAASTPGPACYARGGTSPTVTDASVVLGYLDPANFAGGTVPLRPDLAHEAIERVIAGPLGMTVEQAALGIHRVLNAQMAEAIRLVSIGRGIDPRGYALLPLGGGGPMHGCALADDLGISAIIVPAHPGVLSAAGLLGAPVAHEVAAAFPCPLASLDPAALTEALRDLDNRCGVLMRREGIQDAKVTHFVTCVTLVNRIIWKFHLKRLRPRRFTTRSWRRTRGFTATAPTSRRKSSICAPCISPSPALSRPMRRLRPGLARPRHGPFVSPADRFRPQSGSGRR